jgi:hypothetical protein
MVKKYFLMARFLRTIHVSLPEAQANGKKPAKRDAVAPLHNPKLGEPPARRKRTRDDRSQTPQPGTSRAGTGAAAGTAVFLIQSICRAAQNKRPVNKRHKKFFSSQKTGPDT